MGNVVSIYNKSNFSISLVTQFKRLIYIAKGS